MELEKQLQAFAQEEAEHLSSQARHLMMALHAADNMTHRRAGNYLVADASALHCPGCWVQNECRIGLRNLSGPAEGQRIMRCDNCQTEYRIFSGYRGD